MKCSNCGSALEENSKFCSECGRKNKNSSQKGSLRKPIIPIIIYILVILVFFTVSTEAKFLLTLLVVLFGLINIIVPLKRLLIDKRIKGVGVLLLGIIAFFSVIILLPDNEVETSTINIPQFKEESVTVVYDDLARETDEYIDTKVKLTGKVIQIQESGKNIILRVNVTKGEYNIYDDTVWVNYTMKDGEKHILEEDIINFWGIVKGRKTYKTVLGSSVTIPEIDAVSIKVIK